MRARIFFVLFFGFGREKREEEEDEVTNRGDCFFLPFFVLLLPPPAPAAAAANSKKERERDGEKNPYLDRHLLDKTRRQAHDGVQLGLDGVDEARVARKRRGVACF